MQKHVSRLPCRADLASCLASLLAIGLAGAAGTATAAIVTTDAGGIVGDFSAVSLFGSPTGFATRFGKAGANNEIWRLTPLRQDGGAVPEPSSTALVPMAVLAAVAVRGRQRAHRN